MEHLQKKFPFYRFQAKATSKYPDKNEVLPKPGPLHKKAEEMKQITKENAEVSDEDKIFSSVLQKESLKIMIQKENLKILTIV